MTTRKIMLTETTHNKKDTPDIQWTTDKFVATHMMVNGKVYIKGPGGNWFAPDYTQPGMAEQVRKDVAEAYDAHWSIDRWRK